MKLQRISFRIARNNSDSAAIRRKEKKTQTIHYYDRVIRDEKEIDFLKRERIFEKTIYKLSLSNYRTIDVIVRYFACSHQYSGSIRSKRIKSTQISTRLIATQQIKRKHAHSSCRGNIHRKNCSTKKKVRRKPAFNHNQCKKPRFCTRRQSRKLKLADTQSISPQKVSTCITAQIIYS